MSYSLQRMVWSGALLLGAVGLMVNIPIADIHPTVARHLDDHRSGHDDAERPELLGEVVDRWREPQSTSERSIFEVAVEVLGFAGFCILALDEAEVSLQGSIPAHDDLDGPTFEAGCE